MLVPSFGMAEERQIPVRKRIDDDPVGDDGAKGGHFLPAGNVFQEIVEGEGRQRERLHGEHEAVQQDATTSQRGSEEQAAAVGARLLEDEKERGQQSEQDNFRNEHGRAKGLISVIFPWRETDRRRSDVEPDNGIDGFGGDINAEEDTGQESQFAKDGFVDKLLTGDRFDSGDDKQKEAGANGDGREDKQEEGRRPD